MSADRAPRRALLLVDHGSRRPEAHAHLEQLAGRIRQLAPDWLVVPAHMEIAAPSIEEALEACARAGAEEVVVQPLFLVPGQHLADDIPALVERAAARRPRLRVRIAPSLGEAPGLAELIARTAGLAEP